MIHLTPIKQIPSHCGPASLKMLLSYYGLDLSEKELARRARTSGEFGTHAHDLVRVARELGLKASVRDNSTLLELEQLVKRKVPVIVAWFSEDDGHYSVVVGMDKKYVYLQDPDIGKIRKLTREVFHRVWFDFRGNFIQKRSQLVLRRMIVITPKK